MNKTCSRPRCTRNREHKDLCREHRRMLQKLGVAGYIDATPAREKVQALNANGWSYDRIGERAGVPYATVQRIGRGTSRRACASTVNALAALGDGEGRWIDTTGTRRRIQALVRLGWSYQEIARRSGVRWGTLRKAGYRSTINEKTAERVDRVYRELHLTPGPAVRAVAAARRRGFLPPLAWEPDSIDDPNAQPNTTGYDEATVQALLCGEKVAYETVDMAEMVRRLPSGAVKPLARQLGIPYETVRSIAQRVAKRSAA